MTDRELLEVAGRSVGYKFHRLDYEGCPIFIIDGLPIGWNPLEDDGDAFRLAVQLHITVKPFFSCVGAVTDKNFEGDGYALIVPDCDRGNATKRAKYMRYAIVSAAAGISRSIP